MTETNAKKGMTRFKKGFTSKDFDFGFLNEINYDDKRTMKEVIETLFTVIKELRAELEAQETKHLEMIEKVEHDIYVKLNAFETAFEKNLRDFLTKGA